MIRACFRAYTQNILFIQKSFLGPTDLIFQKKYIYISLLAEKEYQKLKNFH